MKILKLFYYFVGVILILFLFSKYVKSDDAITVKFDSEYITKQNAYRAVENEIITVNFSISYIVKLDITKIELKCKLDEMYVADFVNWTSMMLDVKKDESMLKSIGILIVFRHLGQSNLLCGLIDPRDNNVKFIEIYKFIVQRLPTIIELIFQISASIIFMCVTFIMGCGLDRVIIWNYIKRPVAPCIGFASQYVIMPVLSFSIATLTGINKDFGLGLLLVGCAPGGGTSNIWSVLLHGDLNLSMVMTFLSTITSLMMMPFWLFVFGRFFVDSKYVEIPYGKVVANLLQFVLPSALGIAFRFKFDGPGEKIGNRINCVGSIVVIFLLIFGTYANIYAFELVGEYYTLVPICASLPWLGFIFGGFFAFITKRSLKQIITIGIETGLQNVGIAFLILKYSIPQPSGDLGATVPILIGILTPIPLYLGWLGIIIYLRYKNKNEDDVNNINPLQNDISNKNEPNDVIIANEDVNLKKPDYLQDKTEPVIDEDKNKIKI